MDNLRSKFLLATMWLATAVLIAVMAVIYISFVNNRIEKEGERTLSEVYSQIDNNFDAYIERNWKNLDDWYTTFPLLPNDEAIEELLASRKKLWGFSQFFFINQKGDFVTAQGTTGTFNMGDELAHLFDERHRIMHSEDIDGTGSVTLFAFPVESGTYEGFAYDAIGITYTNEDMVNSLNTDAFDKESSCFIVRPDGTVLLSTQIGGNIFGNYLQYLEGSSNLTEDQIDSLRTAWTDGREGFVTCTVGGVPTYVYYKRINYRGFTLLGVVPQDAANGSMLEIQSATTDVMVKIFIVLLAALFLQFFLRYRKSARRTNAEIRVRDSLFSLLSSNVNDIFILMDAERFKVDYVSPNIKRLLGISDKDVLEDIRAISKCNVVESPAFNLEELHTLKDDDRIVHEEHLMNQDTGELRWFYETAYCSTINDRTKYVVVMSDRTAERKMNDNLQEALDTAKNANRAKSFFLSNMSHDIRTPMNAIIGFTDLISNNVQNPEKVSEYIRKISSSSKHLLSLINDVLDMSKIESGKTSLNMMQFNLSDLKEELVNIIAPQAEVKNISFDVRTEGNPEDIVVGDKLRVNQILLNLLSNAVKYTQEGGKVEFIIKDIPNDAPMYENIKFIVRDNGAGMTPEFLKNVFEPFTRETSSLTNTVQGTGLGMAITKNLIDLMGGVISITSAPGEGTEVVVDLSFALPELVEDEGFWEDRGITRILVVDDEEQICENIVSAMAETGVRVDYALDGESAINKAIAASDDGAPYSLVLLDWKMPQMSGVETAHILRDQIGADVPILVLTAYDWTDIVDEAREAGIDAFLAKPFFLTSLQRTLALLGSEKLSDSTDEVAVVDADRLRGVRFLAAEDNALSAEMLADILDFEGASVEIVPNGKLAVERFVEAEPGTFDMILMDVQMPVMGGYDATRAIRSSGHAQAQEIPIIAMTANVFAEDVKEALEAGMTEHLAKPIDMNTLKLLVERFLS